MTYTMTMKKILAALALLATGSLGIFTLSLQTATLPSQAEGATNMNQVIGGFPYFLAGSGISSSATSITLTSFTLPQTGYEIVTSDLSQPFYLTLEPGNTTRQEFISCMTVTQNPSNATAVLAGCVRGLQPVSPYTANGSYAFSHSGSATIILSNSPQFYQQFYALGNVSTSTNTLIFSSTTPPRYDSPAAQASGSAIATTSELASIAYVNAVTTSGAPNASTAVKGIVQLATGLQAASSTALGSTGAALVVPSSIATDTPNANTNTSRVLMSDLSGYLKQGWLNLTVAWSFAASSIAKLTLNTVAYVFPTSQGSDATVLTNDGSGNLTWGTSWKLLVSTTTQQAMATASTTFSAYTYLHVVVFFSGSTNGSAQHTLHFNNDASAAYGDQTTAFTGSSAYVNNAGGTFMNTGIGTTSPEFMNMDIYNASATKKLVSFTDAIQALNASAATTVIGSGGWNNTSSQITSFAFSDAPGSGQINSGTLIQVYGHN